MRWLPLQSPDIFAICILCFINVDLLALFGIVFTGVSAIEELSIEQLNSDHSKDELKEDVDNEDVEHVFERDDHTVEYSLQFGNSIDGLQRSQHTKKFHRF